jgi:hypothetical protein
MALPVAEGEVRACEEGVGNVGIGKALPGGDGAVDGVIVMKRRTIANGRSSRQILDVRERHVLLKECRA